MALLHHGPQFRDLTSVGMGLISVLLSVLCLPVPYEFLPDTTRTTRKPSGAQPLLLPLGTRSSLARRLTPACRITYQVPSLRSMSAAHQCLSGATTISLAVPFPQRNFRKNRA